MCVSHQIAVSWVRNSTIKGDPWLEYNCKGTGNQWLTNAALYSLKRDTQGVGILIFPTNPGGGGVVQTAGFGSFPRTKREIFSGTFIHLFILCVIFEFSAISYQFGAKCLIFGAQYLIFEPTSQNHVFSRGLGIWGPQGGFDNGVGEKCSAHPLRYIIYRPPRHDSS